VEQRAARVVPVVLESPAAQVALVVSAAPESRAVQAGLVALVALAVPESRAVRAEPVAQVVSGRPVAPAAPGGPESLAVQVGPEPEQRLAEAEQGNVPAAGPALSRPRSPEAVALTVLVVINPQREGAAAAAAP
jgi:hypothetical protein